MGMQLNRTRTLPALVLLLATLMLTSLLSSMAYAMERVDVELALDDATEQELQQAIYDAGTTPTRIHLSRMYMYLTKTLVIPEGADIEIVNRVSAGGSLESALARADGFTGTMVHVKTGGSLTLADNTAGGTLKVLSRGQQVPSSSPIIFVQGSLAQNGGEVSGARGMTGEFLGAISLEGPDASYTLDAGKVTDN